MRLNLTSKIPIFVGDVHGNALAMTQIINRYDPKYFELIWLGDFVNSKLKTTEDKEIEYVLHMMLEHCKYVLHSNHMHVLYEYLHSTVIHPHGDRKDACRWGGWEQTKRVVNSLHPSTKRQIYYFIREKSKFTVHVVCGKQHILAAHASPQMINDSDVIPHGKLTDAQSMSIGVKNPRSFWKQKSSRELINMYDYVIVGHHGFISRLGTVRICDSRGIEIPTWNPVTDTYKLFPI